MRFLIFPYFISLLCVIRHSAETFDWTAPPPAWTPIGSNDIRTVKFPVLNGSTNVALRWNYTLGTGELVASKTWDMDGAQIALVGLITKINDNRFDVDKSEVATLIIKNVSEIEDATIEFRVQTTINNRAYRVRVEVTDKPKNVHLNITAIGKACPGGTVKFHCTADAYPPVNGYVLYENNTRDSSDRSGTWTKIMKKPGRFIFRCEAHSEEGFDRTNGTILTVDGKIADPR